MGDLPTKYRRYAIRKALLCDMICQLRRESYVNSSKIEKYAMDIFHSRILNDKTLELGTCIPYNYICQASNTTAYRWNYISKGYLHYLKHDNLSLHRLVSSSMLQY